MKYSGSKSKAEQLIKQLNILQINQQTPRMKKSHSTFTATNYLQLQLTTSSKKKQTAERQLQIKNKRIKQLQSQIIQNQALVKQTLAKLKQYHRKVTKTQHQYNNSKNAVQTLTEQNMREKQRNRQLQLQNLKLLNQKKHLEQKIQLQRQRAQIEKRNRKKQKQQYKAMLIQLMKQISILKQQQDLKNLQDQ